MFHGSTSGSIDEEAIHYLMTRGIELSKAKKLLINGFLNEIFENIIPKNESFRKEKKILNYFMIMDFQIKKDENWKFTDLNTIVSKNFKNITNNFEFKDERK